MMFRKAIVALIVLTALGCVRSIREITVTTERLEKDGTKTLRVEHILQDWPTVAPVPFKDIEGVKP